MFPDALDIVGIASEPQRYNSRSSEDLMYLDGREWSQAEANEAEKLQKDLNILVNTTISFTHEDDYPE